MKPCKYVIPKKSDIWKGSLHVQDKNMLKPDDGCLHLFTWILFCNEASYFRHSDTVAAERQLTSAMSRPSASSNGGNQSARRHCLQTTLRPRMRHNRQAMDGKWMSVLLWNRQSRFSAVLLAVFRPMLFFKYASRLFQQAQCDHHDVGYCFCVDPNTGAPADGPKYHYHAKESLRCGKFNWSLLASFALPLPFTKKNRCCATMLVCILMTPRCLLIHLLKYACSHLIQPLLILSCCRNALIFLFMSHA